MATALRTSLEEFLADPEIDERRLELIDGEVYEKPMPTYPHGILQGELYMHLRPFGTPSVEARATIPATSDFDASSPIPDLAFYKGDRPVPIRWMTDPPEVVAEVLSPGQSRRDMRSKIDLYLAFGVESVWVIDPATRTVEVYESGNRQVLSESETLTSTAIAGFALPIATLFERVPRED